ncbi:MAG: DNA polymerase III subunit gamma/tau [Chloroflexi bacterium]|nr:MAG: DNA polymerase III subunit gamma/tau [Chloroflexota bacterium]
MASQVFYRKWRPQTLAEVVGQEQVTRTLLNALKSNRVAHAYLFCGPRGTGKTSTGRILAKAVNCLTANGQDEPCNTCSMCRAITEGRALDVIEIDAASNTGVDNIRDLRERANYAPGEARYKVYIIDEVHMLSTSASNALLKTLEEPPPHVIFVLATTEAHKVLPTVLSRCQHFDFRRIAQADVVSRLSQICDSEGVKIKPEALRLVARSATGSLRDAENILEQLITYYGAEIELQQAQATLGISGDRRVKEMVRHIIDNDIAAGITTINSVSSEGLDLRPFNRELIECLRALLLVKTGTSEAIDLPGEDIAELKEIATKASLTQVLKAVKLFGQLESTGFDSYSTLPLELALVDCVLTQEEQPKSQAKQTRPKAQRPAGAAAPPHVPVSTEPPVAKTEAAEVPSPPAEPPEAGPKAVEVPPPSVEIPVAPPEPGSEIEFLKQNWKQIIEKAPADTQKTPAVAFLRSSGKPVAFEDNTVVLAFKFSIHKDNMEKPQNQQVAEKIISSFIGHPCRVRCIFQPEDNHLVEAALKMGAQIIDVEEK